MAEPDSEPEALAPPDADDLGSPGAPKVRLQPPGVAFTVEGWSIAGIETWLRIPEFSLAIDVGRVAAPALASRHLALTHGHLDHAGGLPAWLGLRRMGAMPPARVYLPAEMMTEIKTILAAWERLQGVGFEVELFPARPFDRFSLGSGRSLVALPAHHGVPALGWAVIERRAKLCAELLGKTGPEIRALREAGHVVSKHEEVTLLAISGDTRASAVDEAPALRDAQVVLHEVTLLDDRHPPALAHAGNHTHLHDLRGSAVAAEAGCFVPYHISQRYGVTEARALLQAELGPRFGDRLLPLLPARDPPSRRRSAALAADKSSCC